MARKDLKQIFTQDTLASLFPPERADRFFDALFGDPADGAYDIVLAFKGNQSDNRLLFELHLKERPGQCLACNLTYGLPEVFSRHPVIDIKGLVAEIAKLADAKAADWSLGHTQSVSRHLHVIPLEVTLAG